MNDKSAATPITGSELLERPLTKGHRLLYHKGADSETYWRIAGIVCPDGARATMGVSQLTYHCSHAYWALYQLLRYQGQPPIALPTFWAAAWRDAGNTL